MTLKFSRLHLRLGVCIAVAGVGIAEGVPSGSRLIVHGQPGHASVIQANGRSYVDLEAITHLLNGSLEFHGSEIVLTLGGSNSSSPRAGASEFSKDFVRAGTQLGLAEMIRGGTTTYCDMYYFEAAIAEETERAGVRGLLVVHGPRRVGRLGQAPLVGQGVREAEPGRPPQGGSRRDLGELRLGLLMFQKGGPGPAVHGRELGPGVGRAHVHYPNRREARPGRFHTEQTRGLATLDAAPEALLGGKQ